MLQTSFEHVACRFTRRFLVADAATLTMQAAAREVEKAQDALAEDENDPDVSGPALCLRALYLEGAEASESPRFIQGQLRLFWGV